MLTISRMVSLGPLDAESSDASQLRRRWAVHTSASTEWPMHVQDRMGLTGMHTPKLVPSEYYARLGLLCRTSFHMVTHAPGPHVLQAIARQQHELFLNTNILQAATGAAVSLQHCFTW